MLGLYVSVPIACFRKGLAREYLETEPIAPPATCYGFLLSLVGEKDRRRHVGCRVCPVLVDGPRRESTPSVVLRTIWRVKKKPLGSPGNTRPDYQQLLTHVQLIVWLDSAEEHNGAPSLEARVADALDPERRERIDRFGGLSLGESTHLVDEVCPFPGRLRERLGGRTGHAFLRVDRGRLTLPVWVDHVGSAGTRYVTGDLVEVQSVTEPPSVLDMPRIHPEGHQS